MADNAAQSIKSLDTEIKNLNEDLSKSLENLGKYDKNIADLFGKVADNIKIETDEVVDYVTKQLKNIVIKDIAEGALGIKAKKAADAASKEWNKAAEEAVENTNRRQFEINKAYNEREMQLTEEREKQKLAAEKAYAQEREKQLEAEAKKREEMDKAWAQYEKQQAAARTDVNKLGDLAATRGLTGNLAAIQDTSSYKRYMEERRRLAKQTAQEEAAAAQKTNEAIKQQIQYYRQLHTLYKEYKALQAKPNKTEKDNEILEQTKKKMLEILNLSKKLEMENKGSAAIAKQATEWERVRDRAKGAKKEIQENKKSLEDMLPTLRRLASAFGIAFSVRGLVQFGKKLIEIRGEFELQQVALRSILQNKQLADEIWDKTMRAALQSPFTAMQLTKYTKQLAAYRIETEKLFDTTKRLADVSAGLGVDMQRLILAYGQVKAANYLRASEIRQFTEAGVNILGELSTYLTEMKGEMISTAQVMEMVTKRMVTFADVEAIFKRMTDQGGIFYNMQYIQSQTVKGQIMKLHDAYDQMLNSIGKANEGVLKDMIAALNSIVQNWRTWAVVIKSIAWGSIIGYLSKFALALAGIEGLSVKSLRSIAKLKQGITALGAALKANWLTLAIGAVTALVASLVNLSKKMKEVNAEIDEQNLQLYETRRNFEDLEDKIKSNNKILKTAKEGSEEYTSAQSDNRAIIQKLINEYPDLAKQMEITKDGYISLNGAIETYNRKLNEQMTIQNAMKQETWFSDSDKKNLADWERALSRMKATLLSAQHEANKMVAQMEASGTAGRGFYDIYKQVAEINLSGDILKAVAQFKKLDEEVYGITYGRKRLTQYLDISSSDLQANWSKSRIEDVLKDLTPLLQDTYEKGLKDNTDYLKKINEEYGGNITEFISKNVELINEGTIKGINNANDVIKKTLAPQTEEMRVYLNQELNKLFGVIDETYAASLRKQIFQKQLQLGVAIIKDPALAETLKTEIEELQKQLNTYLKGIDFFAESSGSDAQRQADIEKNKQAFGKMIPLIKEMRAEYDKLSKSAYNAAVSEGKVRESYAQAVREILSKAGVTEGYDFTTNEGMIEALKKVKAFAATLGAEYAAQVEKYIGQLTAETEINVQVEVKKDFAKEIERMFGDYELTLSLAGLNIPPDLFGAETTSLDAISEFLETFKNEHQKTWNEDIKDVYYNALKKVSDIEQKEFDKYVKNVFGKMKNTAQEMGILMSQTATETDFIKKLFNKKEVEAEINDLEDKIVKSTDEAEKKILQHRLTRLQQMYGKIDAAKFMGLYSGIMEYEQDRIRKISTDKLKEMPEYLEAMGRVAGRTNVELQAMLDYLNELIAKGGSDVEISEYKSIIRQINEIKKQIEANDSPFGKMGFAQAIDMVKKNKEYDAEMKELEEERNEIEKERVALLEEEKKIQEELERLKETGVATDSPEYQAAMDKMSKNSQSLADNSDKMKKNYAKVQTINKGNAQTMAIIDAIIHGINDLVQKIYGNLQQIAVIMKDYGYDTEHGSFAKWSKGMETFAKASQDATDGWDAYKQGDIAGIVYNVIKGITDIWHGINEMIGQDPTDKIYEQQKLIEKLTDDYARLAKQIEKTWSTTSYMSTYEEMVANLEQQRAALQEQRKAENSRKNTDEDKIREYDNAIQSINDSLEDLKQNYITLFGGLGEVNYRSAAQEFVDAWKEAFLETGDGLQGLQDHFNEFLQEWFVKQATMRIAGKMLQPLFEQIDRAVDQYGAGGTSVLMSELNAIREKFAAISPRLSDALEALAGQWGLEGEGGLSGLAAGIQGMTEEQANILEAYWNSVRGYTASIDMNVSRIVELLGAGGVNTNPQLQQLELIARNTGAIQSMFNDVILSGHERGGRGIKVFMN